MQKLKMILALTIMILCLSVLIGCQATTENPQGGTDPMSQNGELINYPEDDEESAEQYLDGTGAEQLRENPIVLLQLTDVEPGEELVTLHTTMGDITLRFFPTEAPLAVENFLTHARDGFYDNVIFHRVYPEFMIQGGDPTGTGSGGESIWGEPFGLETSFNLRHFRGALAMAHAGGAMNSQFYIVNRTDVHPQNVTELILHAENQDDIIGRFSDGHQLYLRDLHPIEASMHFLNYGGTPHLDWIYGNPQAHTVFGHVVDGMDVVDAIANVSRDEDDRPFEDVFIEKISFIIYE